MLFTIKTQAGQFIKVKTAQISSKIELTKRKPYSLYRNS